MSNHYGSAHDSRVYRTSTGLKTWVDNLTDGYHIVADKSYIGYSNILMSGLNKDESIDKYTNLLASQRLIVENAFGLFKGKFKRFYHEQINGHSEKL